MNYNQENMKELLKLVRTGFSCDLSDEGDEYWARFRIELYRVVRASGNGSIPNTCEEDPGRKPTAEDYSKVDELLEAAFSWRDSPQGEHFWDSYSLHFQSKAKQLRDSEKEQPEPEEDRPLVCRHYKHSNHTCWHTKPPINASCPYRIECQKECYAYLPNNDPVYNKWCLDNLPSCPDCGDHHEAPPCPEAGAESKPEDPVVDPNALYRLTDIMRNGFYWPEGMETNFWKGINDDLNIIASKHSHTLAPYNVDSSITKVTSQQLREIAELLGRAIDGTKTEQGLSDWERRYNDLISWSKELEETEAKQRPQRGTILDQAKAIINGERQDQYGNPEDSFGLIAGLWSSYLEHNITSHDVAMMLTLMKLARQKHQRKPDNLIDACGYLALAAEMVKEGE
jgi:hypothetical protein